jgi:hypothetical protein
VSYHRQVRQTRRSGEKKHEGHDIGSRFQTRGGGIGATAEFGRRERRVKEYEMRG